MKRARCINF